MSAQLQAVQTKPRRFFMVTRPDEAEYRRVYESREDADLSRQYHQMEKPTIGPWEVIELVEVA